MSGQLWAAHLKLYFSFLTPSGRCQRFNLQVRNKWLNTWLSPLSPSSSHMPKEGFCRSQLICKLFQEYRHALWSTKSGSKCWSKTEITGVYVGRKQDTSSRNIFDVVSLIFANRSLQELILSPWYCGPPKHIQSNILIWELADLPKKTCYIFHEMFSIFSTSSIYKAQVNTLKTSLQETKHHIPVLGKALLSRYKN